jgi:hypothetical protein
VPPPQLVTGVAERCQRRIFGPSTNASRLRRGTRRRPWQPPIDRAGLLLAPHSTHASTGNYSETNSTTMPSTPSTQTTNAAASSLFSHCMRRRSECRRGTRHLTREVQRCRQRESGRTAHLDDQHTASVSRPGGGSSSVATAYLGLYDHFSQPPCAGERVDKSGREIASSRSWRSPTTE